MKQFLKLLFLLLLCAIPAFGQGVRYDNFVLKPLAIGGVTPVSGALITVCTSAGTGTPCTPKVANIYSDQALTVPLTGTGGAGTTNSDANGNYGFYIAPGDYVITVTGSGITSATVKLTLPCAASNCASLTISGAATLTGATTIGQLNNCFIVDGVKYTTIQAAIAAAPGTGCVYIPPGNYAPTSTITINKTLSIFCANSNSSIITPTNAVTGAAIAINPAVSDQVILRGCDIEMTAVPGIPAITANNLGANSEISEMIINGGTIGIDVTNSSVFKFYNDYITNQTQFGIRDNADGGAEHHYDSVWLINNNSVLAPTTTALFEYVRTTATDTGGLYMDNVRAIANVIGGTVTNGIVITSSAGTRSILHAFIDDLVCDGNFAADCMVLNNVQRVTFNGGQISTGHANAGCATATVSCFAALSLVGTAQIHLSSATTLISNNRSISMSGPVDLTDIYGSRLYSNGSASNTAIFVVTGAAITNLNVWNPDIPAGQVYSNNEAALIAATPSQTYSVNGKIGLAPGTSAAPSLSFNFDPGLGMWLPANNTVAFNTTPGGTTFKYDNTGLFITAGFALKPTTAGGVDVGTTLLPFGSLWLGTAATNNFKFQSATTAGARIINLWDFGANGPSTQNYPGITILTSQYTNSTTGFTNVVGGNTIQFPVLANTTYTAECHLYYQSAATGGLNIEFTGPASPTNVIYGLDDPSAATTFNSAVATAYGTSLGAVVGTAATNFDALVSFSLINGANAGTVNLLAKSSAAVQLQIQAGSFCRIQ